MPSSLIAWVVFLFVLLMLAAYLSMKDRIKDRRRYHKIDTHHSVIEQNDSSPVTYQNSSDYALPPKQKYVTYCVVDGRLIDK